MFTSKKKKIRRYLENIPDADKTGFDFLLLDYLTGVLKNDIEGMGITKAEIYIDWQKHAKCISVQGRSNKYYMCLLIYPDEFCLSFDLDEPDKEEAYPMGSKDYFYQVLTKTIDALM